MVVIGLCVLIDSFYFILGLLVFVGTFGNFLCYSSLVLVEESVCPERRSLYGNIVNIGYTFCGIVYVIFISSPNVTRIFGLKSSMFTFLSTLTIYFPSDDAFTKTLSFPNIFTTSAT